MQISQEANSNNTGRELGYSDRGIPAYCPANVEARSEEFDLEFRLVPDFFATASVLLDEPAEKPSKESVFYWLCQNPGKDSEDVAREFNISPMDADDIVRALLSEGLLDLA